MCLVVYEFILSLRYFFWMYTMSAYPYLLITNSFLQSITCYLVCAVFTNQAFAATENQSAWIPRTLNALLLILLGIYTVIAIIEFIPVADPNQKSKETACKSIAFLAEAVVDILVCFFFICMGIQLERFNSK